MFISQYFETGFHPWVKKVYKSLLILPTLQEKTIKAYKDKLLADFHKKLYRLRMYNLSRLRYNLTIT